MNLNLSRVDWSETAAQILAPVCADEPGGMGDVELQVRKGTAELFKVETPHYLVGFYVVRIDQLTAGNELVIVAAASRPSIRNLIDIMLPILEAQAAMSHCSTVRIHTNRPGMVKKIAQRGYGFSEWVFRKKVNP